jgi:choline dehydrogenase
MKVSDPVQICDLSRAYVMAAQAAGIPFTPDFNGPRQAGTGFVQLTTRAAGCLPPMPSCIRR